MARRVTGEIQAIIDAIAEDVENSRRDNVITVSATELAKEYDIHPNTATEILRGLGYEYDGAFWYKVGADE